MKLKYLNLNQNWHEERLKCEEFKNEIKTGGHHVEFRDIEL